MTILVFDIETIPDIRNGGELFELASLNEEEGTRALQQLRYQESGRDFMPHYLQQIVAISAVLQTQGRLKVWSLGDLNSNEEELIQRFFEGIDRFEPTLVSWNGAGFDLPVLHYRALLHGISAPRYWEVEQSHYKFNNYLNRYHYRHMDLMDILSGYQLKAAAPLDKLAQLLGFPGKMGQSGASVAEQYYAGDLQGIRDYCETDVLNTYLIYLRFEKMRGKLTQDQYALACEALKTYLCTENKPHFQAFFGAWSERESNESPK